MIALFEGAEEMAAKGWAAVGVPTGASAIYRVACAPPSRSLSRSRGRWSGGHRRLAQRLSDHSCVCCDHTYAWCTLTCYHPCLEHGIPGRVAIDSQDALHPSSLNRSKYPTCGALDVCPRRRTLTTAVTGMSILICSLPETSTARKARRG